METLFVERTYTWLKIALIGLFYISLFGFWKGAPEYLNMLDNVFNITVAMILIYFFNPLRKTICNDFHRRVAFSAGVALLIQFTLLRYLHPGCLAPDVKKLFWKHA